MFLVLAIAALQVGPTYFGACVEDVNHEIYGGLYDQRIFGESFEEPPLGAAPQGWQRFGGRWVPDGSGIHVMAQPGAKLVYGKPMADGTVEVKVRTSNDFSDNAGLLVRVSDPGDGADAFNGYEVALDTKQRQLLLGKHVHDFRLLRAVPADIRAGVWQSLKVQMEGPRLRLFVNGKPLLDYTDADSPLLTGSVALRTWNSDVTFGGLKMNGQSVPLNLSGPGLSSAWDAIGAGDFDLQSGAVTGQLCQHIVCKRGATGIANAGLNWWGIAVWQGEAMEGSLYARGGRLTVALQSRDGSQTYASQTLRAGVKWQKIPFTLATKVTDPHARFAILLEQPGELWLDQVTLFDAPSRRFQGLPVRKDIGNMLVKGGYGFLRYGGTMVNEPGYRWKNMIGPREQRPPYVGHWYPCSSNGFGIFDFLQFCEKANCAAAFAINVEETPQDAADLADYLTAPTTNPWGKKRAEDGHPRPYHPNFIELGNEEGIGNLTPDALSHYSERFKLLAHAIHSRNPNLKLVCGCWWDDRNPGMETVFRAIDGEAAAWDLHFWCDAPDAGISVGKGLDEAKALFQKWNSASSLKTVIFEENGNHHGMDRALGHASTLTAVLNRADFVLADCAANGLQPDGQNDNGWDQGQVFFSPDKAWGVPPYFVQQMASKALLREVVKCPPMEGLHVVATRSQDGNSLAFLVVNPGKTARPFTYQGDWRGHAETLNEDGTQEPLTCQSEGGKVTLKIPAHSVTTISLGA